MHIHIFWLFRLVAVSCLQLCFGGVEEREKEEVEAEEEVEVGVG